MAKLGYRKHLPFTYEQEQMVDFLWQEGWSGGAMVLGKLPVPGRPTILITVGQGLVGWLVVLGLTAL